MSYTGANATVLIDNPCNLKLLTISKGISNEDYSTTLFMSTVESIDYRVDTLPARVHWSMVTPNNSIGLNYYDADSPVYTAKDGLLQYNITISSINGDKGDCSLQLHLFDSVDDYASFLSTGCYSSSISTHCISGESAQTHSVTFSLPSRGFYFVGLKSQSTASLIVSITGTLTSFILTPPYLDTCQLDDNHDRCTLDSTGSTNSRHYVFAESQSTDVQSVLSSLSCNNLMSFCIMIPVIGLTSFGILTVIIMILCRRKEEKDSGLFMKKETVVV